MADTTVETRPGRGRCAIASSAIPAGTVLTQFSGEPFAHTLLPSQFRRRCASCLQTLSSQGMRCSRCKQVRYCSQACQVADWPEHKHECPALASPILQALGDSDAANVLLLGRCMWARQLSVPDVIAAFDALCPGEVTEADRTLANEAMKIPGLLPPKEYHPRVAARTLAAFRCNNFGILDDLHAVVGAGCYPTAALLNHSCVPNCVLVFRGTRLSVTALKDIAAGEELCHSFADLLAPTATRRASLEAQYGFVCDCRRCTDGLTTAADLGTLDIEACLTAELSGADPREIGRARLLLLQAREEDDDEAEWALVREGAGLLRLHLNPLNAELNAADRALMTVALACGDVAAARDACLRLCEFLSAVLKAVGACAHPLFALQQFTLADLEAACGNASGARDAMDLCVLVLTVTHGAEGSALLERAKARLAELR